MTEAKIREIITAALPDARITMEDLAGDGDHWRAHVVSSAFRGKTRVQQHQLVYAAFGSLMGNELHALALTTEIAPAPGGETT